jgi:PAS domain S-box-containing protein
MKNNGKNREQKVILHGDHVAVEIVTEVRREEALLKAGALQSAIFNSANFSSIATDAKGVIQIFNVGAERMLGYTAAEVTNKITPADISDPQEVIARATALSVELGTPITPGFEALVFKASRGIEDIYELTYIRKDGSRFPAVVSVTALRDAQDVIIGYLLIGTDNTARKQAEEALLKAGALQSAIFNSANFSSIATDAKGVIQIFNVGAERMLGYTAAEVMNKITPADISDPQEVIVRAKALSVELGTPITPGFEALVFKASRGIEDIYELTYFRKDGSRFPAVVSVTALRDAQDAIIGYLLIGTDNTARKQAEEALLKAGALQSAIFNSANFSSIATDAKGVIQIFNVGAERMLGYTAAEVMNKITPADISDPQEVIARATTLSNELGTLITPGFEALVFKASRGIEDIYELTYIRKDGSRFPAVVSVTALRDAQDAIIGYLLIGTDNTARKQAEEALLKAGALQSAIFNSANFSSIATDAKGVIQIFNVGAEQMLGYTAAEVMNKITPADISDPQEVIARATALSVELGTTITPGFEALVFKASRGIEDIYELTYFRKDGSRFPAVVSVTALRDAQDAIIGYLLIGTDNTARKQAEEALLKAGALQSAIFNSANFSSIATDAKGVIQIFNVGAERMLGYTAAEVMNKITPADISDPQEVIARATALSVELGTTITPGFEALVFKASRGIEDIYELTYFRKDGSRFPAVVSVTALRDAQDAIIGYLLIGTDNTARKQAEEALLKAGALQSAIFNSANFSSIATDAKGVIQIFNVGAERMLGYTAAEVMNKITPADISDPQEVIARATALSVELETPITPGFEALVFKASRGIEDIYELTYIRKDGSRFPAVVSVTALRDAQDAIIGYLLIGTDNTARKQAEEALLKAGALQSAIFNSANFSSIATDAKGVIQIFNVGAERMLGYTAAEVMNKITPADISDPQEVIARAKGLSVELETPITPGFEALVFKASRGIEDIYELTYIRKDGSRFPAVVSVTALRDAQDAIIGYLLIGTDNTARKQVEAEQQKLDQRLRDQQFYTRSLIESNIDALMTTDPHGIITDVNKQMEALTACTRDELIGAPFKKYFTDPERAEAGIKLVLSEKKVTDYELTAWSRDGKKTDVSYNATTFYDRDRKLQGVFAAARDVTDRKRVGKKLKIYADKLERSNRELQDFAQVASHDLQEPLRKILSFGDRLKSKASESLDADSQDYLQRMCNAATRMQSLITDLMMFSKVETNSQPFVPVDLGLIAREVSADLETRIEQAGGRVEIEELPTIDADPMQMRQLLQNLIGNSLKYFRPGVPPVVRIYSQKLDARSPDFMDESSLARQLCQILVVDNGIGFDEKYLDRIFTVFQRLHKKGEYEGTGVGLAICRKIVDRHSGTITARSRPGEGTTFVVTLPVTQKKEVEVL